MNGGRLLAVNPNPALDRMEVVQGFALGEPLRAIDTVIYPGGSGVHAALVASQLGAPAVRVVAPVGGPAGAHWRSMLEKQGVLVTVVEIAGETRTNVSIVDAERGAQVELIEAGPGLTEANVQALLAAALTWVQAGTVVIIGGSLPPGLDAGAIGTLIAAVHERGGTAICDVAGSTLDQALRQQADWIKVNAFEFATGVGVAANDPAAIWRELRRLTAPRSHVVVSLGRWGTLMKTPAQPIVYLEPLAARPFNPIGSGDAMVGAIAAGVLRGLAPASIMAQAVAAATDNMAYVEAGRVSPHSVAILAKRVKARPVTNAEEVFTWIQQLANASE